MGQVGRCFDGDRDCDQVVGTRKAKRGRSKKLRIAALIRRGEMCSSCGRNCGKEQNELNVIECPICDGISECDQCSNGMILLDRCPRESMPAAFIYAVNLAGSSGSGDWPVAGGLLDQATWFLELKQNLDAECDQIDKDRMEKAKRGS